MSGSPEQVVFAVMGLNIIPQVLVINTESRVLFITHNSEQLNKFCLEFCRAPEAGSVHCKVSLATE
jgi:hypothetical protein